MPEPLRSPKQSRAAAKARGHPYHRPANLQRTARDVGADRPPSLFGTIKSIVTAPLSWLASGGTQRPNGLLNNEHVVKRKVSFDERSGTPPNSKRVRRNSSEPNKEERFTPASASLGTKRPPIPLWDMGNGVPRARMQPIDQPQPPANATEFPLPPSRGVSRISMSVEPLDKLAARRSMTRDRSLPPPSPFARGYSSLSLTPQPAGATFGPSPKRKPRESSVPPVIPVPSVPRFVRPSSSVPPTSIFRRPASREPSEGPIMSLMSQTRQSLSPVQQIPEASMLGSMEVTAQHTPNKVERTLASLEAYRTPLHPPQFPSAAYPEDRRPRKVHVPLPSRLNFDHVPNGKKRRPSIVQPYSAEMSGMRKLLQRRKEELEKEKKEVEQHPTVENQEVDSGVGTQVDETEEADVESEKQSEKTQEGITVNGKAVDAGVRSSKADSYAGLRVPTSRLTRTHASAPRRRNKFSLKDDDEDEQSLTVEELKSYQAKLPPQLLFASMRRMSEAGMQTEASTEATIPLTGGTSPPQPAQPQSFDTLLSRIGPPVSKPTLEFPPEATKASSEVQAQPTFELLAASTAPVTLPFSLGVTKPSAPKPPDATSPFAPTFSNVTTSTPTEPPSINGVPSFFSSSKAQFTLPTLPSSSLFGSSSIPDDQEKTNQKVNTTTTLSVDQASNAKPSLQFKASEISANISNNGESAVVGLTNSTMPPTLTEVKKPAVSLGEPSSTEQPSKSVNIFETINRPTEAIAAVVSDDASSKQSFGITSGLPTPSPSSEFPISNVTSAAIKPTFTFGSSSTANATPFVFGSTGEAKNVLETTTPASAFAFSATPITSSQTATTNFSAGTSSDASKPIFNNFGSNAGASTVPTTPKPTDTKLENGDSMEVADRMDESPTRTVEKKENVSFPATQPPLSMFNPTGGGSGFTFSQPKPDEGVSTGAFSFGVPKPSGGFPFGQGTSSSGFNFGAKPAEQSSTLFGASTIVPSPFTPTPPATSSGPSFTFGGGSTTTAPSAFGQPKQDASGTTPSSPFLAPQPPTASSPSFAFNVPPIQNTFGATKADGNASSSPSTTPFQFGQPNGPPSGSQQLFNLGGAAVTPPRKMKALPTRRPRRP